MAATCGISVPRCVPLASPFRNTTRTQRAHVLASAAADKSGVTPKQDFNRRSVLTVSIEISAAFLVASSVAEAKSIQQASREREERKRVVRAAAAQAREEGVSLDTGLSSDRSLPEGAQRGRNSRTVPQKRSE